ncbi:unnamed protein product [Caenorhabditis brenneri]
MLRLSYSTPLAGCRHSSHTQFTLLQAPIKKTEAESNILNKEMERLLMDHEQRDEKILGVATLVVEGHYVNNGDLKILELKWRYNDGPFGVIGTT